MPANKSQLYAEAKSQAQVRLVICAFMGAYYAMFGLANHPIYLTFAGYTIALMVWTINMKGNPRVTAAISLVLDNSFAICGLKVTGESGTFLLFFLIHVSFAYGLRFGREYLVASLLLSCLGVSWLYLEAAPWQGRIHFLLSFLFGMPFIALYVYALTERLRASEAAAKRSDERTAQLLTLLTHDIRAPLQSLLESVRRLKSASSSSRNRLSLSAIERIVTFMATMVSSALDGERLTERPNVIADDASTTSLSVSVNQWIFTFFEVFRDSVQAKSALLRFSLDAKIYGLDALDFFHLERALINVISNALRHCENGYVVISTTLVSGPMPKIRISIENSSCQQSAELVRHSFDIVPLGVKLHGTGLGLEATQNAAIRAGASFTFEDIDGARFLSVFEIERRFEPRLLSFSTARPVVVISSDVSDWLKYFESLGGTANIYWMSATNVEVNGLPKITYNSEPIYIYIDTKGRFESEVAIPQSLSGTRCLWVSDAPNMTPERVLVGEHWVSLHRDAPFATWVLALEIADSLADSIGNEDLNLGNAKAAVRNLRILALDDNPLNLLLLDAGLRAYDVNLEQVSTVSEAKSALKINKYDLLILDWNIGVTTAHDFLSMAAPHFVGDPPNILILTAQELDIGSIKKSTTSRITILVKPVSSEVIFSALCDLANIDGAVNLIRTAINPNEVFNFSGYLDLGLTAITLKLAEGLLTTFIEELRVEFFDVPNFETNMSRYELDLHLHKLASVCYSAGAYTLGDIFKRLRIGAPASESEGMSHTDFKLSEARHVYGMTRVHVEWFLVSLRNYLQNDVDSRPAPILRRPDF